MSMQMDFQLTVVAAGPEPDGGDAMRELAAATGGTVLLVGWADDSLSCLLRCDPPPQPLAIPQMDCSGLLPGTEALLHVLLAWSPPDVLDRRLTRLPRAPVAVRNRALLALRLARVRATGHDLLTGGLRDEVTSIAAPVRDEQGQVVAGIALVTPSVYLEDLDLQTIAAELKRQAADLGTRRS
jgi:DNA-binding IclR family transcriptional regulator